MADITRQSKQTARRLEAGLAAVWLLFAAAYAGVYFHTYFGNMMHHFLRLPEKAPTLWRWLDPIF